MCSCRILRNPGRLPKSPRMFSSLVLYHNNPLANSEPPKDREKIKASVSSASLRLFVFSPISTAIYNAVAAPLCRSVFASSTATKRRGYNLRRICDLRHAFFQPFPFPSGASAGAISGVTSTSSGVSSQPTSIRDFSWCSLARSM